MPGSREGRGAAYHHALPTTAMVAVIILGLFCRSSAEPVQLWDQVFQGDIEEDYSPTFDSGNKFRSDSAARD